MTILSAVRLNVLPGCVWVNGWQCPWLFFVFVSVTAMRLRRNYLMSLKNEGLWLKQMLIQNTEIPCRHQAFAAHQHSRVNKALLSSFLTICLLTWQIWYCRSPLPPSLPHRTWLKHSLPELGHKAAGLSSLLLNGWWILNHSSVLGVYSHSKTLWLTKNKSCTNVLKLVLL